MDFDIPLDEMTIEDKLATMERLWEDLCRHPESIPSPAWHEDVLLEREKEVREGRAKFSAIDEVKNRIRSSIK